MNIPISDFPLTEANTTRLSLVQTTAWSHVINEVAGCGDIGFLHASAETFRKVPGLQVGEEEDVVLAVAVTPGACVEWRGQTEDWLIPYNEVNRDGGPIRTMVRLGNGSLAIEGSRTGILGQVRENLIVAYLFPDCIAAVRYRWNRKLLETLEDLDWVVRFYNSVTDESNSVDMRCINREAILDRAVYGKLLDGGAVELWT